MKRRRLSPARRVWRTFRQRNWHRCEICQKPIDWKQVRRGYSVFCSEQHAMEWDHWQALVQGTAPPPE